MGGSIAIKHSYNCGDLVAALPGLRQLYRDTGKKIKVYQRLNLPSFYYHNQINSTVDDKNESVCMNQRLFDMMKPLIEEQDYIESFEVWEGQKVDLDYDLSRDTKSVPMPAGLLHTYSESVFPQTSTDLSVQWLLVEPNFLYLDKVIINRTQRYVNPYVTFFFLKDYENQLVFSGTETEHEDFCKQNKLNIDRLDVKDFLELASIISCCRFGIFNQSLNFHISDGLKTPRILEVCAAFPNTFATGKNGYHAFGQAAMEFHVKKLISQ